VCAGLVRGGARCLAALLAVFAIKALSGPKRRWGCFGANQAIKAIWGPTPRIPIQTTSVF